MWYWAEYSTFSINDETDKYRLTVAGYSGDATDAMAGAYSGLQNANGRMFSTLDQDNDDCSCACAIAGGWWFGWCTVSNINENNNALFYYQEGGSLDVEISRMLVKVD